MEHIRIAFFDVDHTITRHATGTRLAIATVLRGIVKARHLLSIPRLYRDYRAGTLDISGLDRVFPALAGLHRDELEVTADRTFEKQIKKDIFPAALELITGIKASGCRVVLATSAIDTIARKVADYIKVDDLIASKLEFVDGVSTGRFDGTPAFGPAKLEYARTYASAAGIPLSACAFYSDSIHDLPLLLEVGKSVAVNPDKHLEREALKRGWEILRFR